MGQLIAFILIFSITLVVVFGTSYLVHVFQRAQKREQARRRFMNEYRLRILAKGAKAAATFRRYHE